MEKGRGDGKKDNKKRVGVVYEAVRKTRSRRTTPNTTVNLAGNPANKQPASQPAGRPASQQDRQTRESEEKVCINRSGDNRKQKKIICEEICRSKIGKGKNGSKGGQQF